MVNIYEIPIEIWGIISTNLSQKDVVNLFNTLLEYNVIQIYNTKRITFGIFCNEIKYKPTL